MNILITGASRGIGKGLMGSLSGDGHTVVSMSRSEPAGGYKYVKADLARPDMIGAYYQEALGVLDGPYRHFDVLINNAGVLHQTNVKNAGSLGKWQADGRETIQVNLLAAMDLTYLFVEHLLTIKNRLPGKVINICSRVSFKPDKLAPHYNVSKAALAMFTYCMAQAHSTPTDRIWFYGIAPCWVDTDMAVGTREKQTADIPTGRITTVKDVVTEARYLLYEDTEQMTGGVRSINGGSWPH